MQDTTKITQRTATAASGSPVRIFSFSGDITSTAKDSILSAYRELDGSTYYLLLDFTAVEYINSSGIAIIIQMLLDASKAGNQTVAIFGLSSHFNKVFTMVGINKYAALHPDEAAAIASI
ncbi:MAG: STAS domain-containing protein [Acidobacteria bacterium]|jgi:anti-anti-sigma factor|nr:STAS domain-containing protein [Acidobacteriota bacterium]